MPQASQSCDPQTVNASNGQQNSSLIGGQKNQEKGQQAGGNPGLRDRLWPIRIERLKAHKIPATQHLKMPRTIWVSSVIINILGVALPLLILQVYDRIIPNQSLGTLMMLVLGFMGVMALEFGLRVGRAYVLGWAATRFEVEAGQKAIGHLLHASFEQVGRERAQTQMDRLTSIFRLADFFGSANSLLIIDLPFVLILVAVMGLIAGPLVLVPLVVLTVFALLTLHFGRNLKKRFEERDDQDNKTYDFISESLRGVITLKGLSMEPFMLRRFERLQKARAQTSYGTILASSTAQSVSSILGNVTIIATVSVGGILAVMSNLSIGTLAACTLLSGRIIQPVVRFAGLWTEFQRLELAMKEAGELFQLPLAEAGGVRDKREGPPQIRVENIRLYKDELSQAGPFSLKIEEGECIGITGKDLDAKGALLNQLSGISTLETGKILLNDIDVQQYRNGNPGEVVMVGPKSAVFDGTILDNLSLYGTGPTLEAVQWAANMTGIDYDVNCLPLGYDTVIGDGAAEKLPQGLIQRILLTRAIAMVPKVLILDEPQMFLDQASDQKLVTCLSALRHQITIIVSTMRPSYFKLVDRLLRFDDGAFVIETMREIGEEGPRSAKTMAESKSPENTGSDNRSSKNRREAG